MASTILCIFEGAKREPHYFASLQRHFFSEEAVVQCSYGNDLYHLLSELEQDDDLDIVELIRDSTTQPRNRALLEGIERDSIAQVFLFFDMEYHDNGFSIENLKSMLAKFNEETEHGKLYISYPMVEALRDVPSFEDFLDLKVTLEEAKATNYKDLSATRAIAIPPDHRKITHDLWCQLIRISTQKAQQITITQALDCPEQGVIFEAQIRLLESESSLYVLSAFPIFLREYFGDVFEISEPA